MINLDDYDDLPARSVAVASMRAIEAGDREAWLALFGDDAVVHDPIGESPLDPSGRGHHGLEAIGAFYDTVIASASITFEVRESYVAGNECANVGTITSRFPDGSTGIVDGVYTYRIDGDNKLIALRAYWEFDKMRFSEP